MRRSRLTTYLPTEYESSVIESVENPQAIAAGSRNVIIAGAGKPTAVKAPLPQAGKTGSRYMTQAGDAYAGLGGFGDASGKGSVVRVMAGLFFAGTGTLHYDGASLGAVASSILQLKLLASGAFGTTYQAGLSQPSAPTIAARTALGTGATGKNKAGTYSVKIYKIRSATGARSNASPASNLTAVTETNGVGQSIRVTFPSIGANGEDRWGVCVTPRNFGSTGPYFLLMEVAESALATIDSVPRSYEIEWTDGDLQNRPLAPVESAPPPACVFVGALGNSVFVDGCYGDTVAGVSAAAPGTVIACSLPLRPEEFPIDWLAFPPDAPTGLLRGGDGFYYRFGTNSLGVISYTGGEPPITYQLLWGTTGISYPHNAVVAEGGRLYLKAGARGLLRVGTGGEPEGEWAAKVLDDVAGWSDPDTVLGWDEDSGNVCFMNDRACIPFNSRIGRWGAPQDLTGLVPGKIVAAVTHLRSMYIACLDAPNSAIKLYKYNAGAGTVMKVITDWHRSAGKRDYIREINVSGRFDSLNPVALKVFKNNDLTAPVLSVTRTPPAIGAPINLPRWRGLIPDCLSFCVSLEQQNNGGDAGFELVEVEGYGKAVSG